MDITIFQAAEILLFGKKLTAMDAYSRNLITAVFDHADFERKTTELIAQFANLPPQSLALSKGIMRLHFNVIHIHPDYIHIA